MEQRSDCSLGDVERPIEYQKIAIIRSHGLFPASEFTICSLVLQQTKKNRHKKCVPDIFSSKLTVLWYLGMTKGSKA
jgi:hypothetical protein